MLTREELIKLYYSKSITAIAAECRVTRATIYAWLAKHGIERKGFSVEYVCDWCGNAGTMRQKDFEQSELHFCCQKCRVAYLRSPEYRKWREDQRMARFELEKKLNREIRPGEVICTHGPEARLFLNHATHMGFHHGKT